MTSSLALASSIVLLRQTPRPFVASRRTILLAVAAVALFVLVQLARVAAVAVGLPAGPTLVDDAG